MTTVLVTGASRGLGLEFTRQYLAEGYAVIAAARNPGAARSLQQLERDPGVASLWLKSTSQIPRACEVRPLACRAPRSTSSRSSPQPIPAGSTTTTGANSPG